MGADRHQWQFPKNEVGKVLGWSDEASPSNPLASKGMVNKNGAHAAGNYEVNADVEAARVPPIFDAVRTAGYSAVGDDGGALYRRVATEPTHAGKIQSADGAWWELAEDIVRPEMFGAVGDGVAVDLTPLQSLANFVVFRGGGTMTLTGGKEYYLGVGGTLYINADGTATGQGIDGVTIAGESKQGSRIIGIVSIGYRDVVNASQTGPGGERQASNSIAVRWLEVEGALELYSLQRASTLFDVRVKPTQTRGLYGVFCNTIVGISVRVDDGGNDNDAIVWDTCPNLIWIGGSCNYNRSGFKFVKERSGSVNTTSPKVFGMILEGNRQISADIRNCTSGKFDVHVVTSIHWDSAFPHIRIGGATSTTDTLNCEVSGYINGRNNTEGDGVSVLNSQRCRIAGMRFSNLLNGINFDGNGLNVAVRDLHFDATVANSFAGDFTQISTQSGTMIPFSGIGSSMGTRSNRWENVAGNLIHLGIYPVATLPTASGNSGAMIYVSDASGGAIPCFSNGVSWLRVDDRTVVS